MTFEIVNDFSDAMEEAWDEFKAEHPQAGDSHEKSFRYAYAKGWDDLKSKLNKFVDNLEE
jgi:hypothetical protein